MPERKTRVLLLVLVFFSGLGFWLQTRPISDPTFSGLQQVNPVSVPTQVAPIKEVGPAESLNLEGAEQHPLVPPQKVDLASGDRSAHIRWQSNPQTEHYQVYLARESFGSPPKPERYQALRDGRLFDDLTEPELEISALLNGARYYLVAVNVGFNKKALSTEEYVFAPRYPIPDGGNGQLNPTGADSDKASEKRGFQFVKLDHNGLPLAASASTWNCVLDKGTQLVWERKQGGNRIIGDEGLHDADDKFNWLVPGSKREPGLVGVADDDGPVCWGYNKSDPYSYCNTAMYVHRVNQEGYCGFHDWRMPTVDELMGLVDYGRAAPAIDTSFFPGTKFGLFYWTGTPTSDCSYSAWFVYFLHGCAEMTNHINQASVRLVRSSQL